MPDNVLLAALGAAFIWGLRHGVDWDHIAAITDITSTQSSRRSGIALGTLYALGHAVVVGLLGVLAVLFGARLPGWVDHGIGYVVGFTLILLGGYVVISLIRSRKGEDFRIRSRWWLALNGSRHLFERVRAAITRTPRRTVEPLLSSYGPRTAVTVGAIHGVGAETPTQVVVFAAAAGLAAGTGSAVALLAAFLGGMLVTNSLIILAAGLGYASATRHRAIFIGSAVVTAVFSLGVGLFFLLGADAALPAFFGDLEALRNAPLGRG